VNQQNFRAANSETRLCSAYGPKSKFALKSLSIEGYSKTDEYKSYLTAPVDVIYIIPYPTRLAM
jgi:hypothetical protein